MELSEWREELAGVLHLLACTRHTTLDACEDAEAYREDADMALASPAMARLLAAVRAEAWDDGVRQAVSWLQADYPYGDMPDWRQSGVDWLLDRRLEHRTATAAHPTDDHAGEAK